MERDIVIPEVISSKAEALFQRTHSLVEGISKREMGDRCHTSWLEIYLVQVMTYLLYLI